MVVHPFEPVTVSVYKPGFVTVSVAPVPSGVDPFDQAKVPVPIPVRVIDVTLQFSSLPGAVIEAVGATMFCVITWLAVSVHPKVLVTVTI